MLEFNYCECGCKGSESETIGKTSWWYYISLREDLSIDKVFLHRGHGFISPLIKECDSVEEAVRIATKEARIILENNLQKLEKIEKEKVFRKLLKRWRSETAGVSSATKLIMHPAYQSIIGLGMPIVPYILRDLSKGRGHWDWALRAIAIPCGS